MVCYWSNTRRLGKESESPNDRVVLRYSIQRRKTRTKSKRVLSDILELLVTTKWKLIVGLHC